MAFLTPFTRDNFNSIAKQYGIAEMTAIHLIEGGNANTSYLIHANNCKYVLTIVEEKSSTQTTNLALLLQWLKRHQFYTSAICATLSGEIISQFEAKPIILKKWIPGIIIKDFKDTMLEEIGQNLAKLHQIPIPEFLSKSHAYGADTFSDVIGKKIDIEYEAWLQKQQVIVKKNMPPNLPIGLIHGDLFFDNIIFEDQKLKAIIDFETACSYYLIFDVGMSILGLCTSIGEIKITKIKALIHGYEQVRQLEQIEKDYLLFFIRYAAAATSKWRYWKYNIDTPNVELRDKHLEMVRVSEGLKNIHLIDFKAAVFN